MSKSESPKRFLLVGWDAACWKFLNPLVDEGQLPALNQVVETGIVGELLACQPLNAASLWTSVATGKRPWQHSVTHASELDPENQNLIPVGRSSCRASPLWEMLARHGRRSIVVGWPATHGRQAERLSLVSNRYSEPTAPPGVKPWPPARPGTYWPRELAGRLDPLRVSPEDVGAGVVAAYIPKWKTVDQKRDHRIAQLRVLLAPDLSHAAAVLELIQRQEWDFAAVRFPALGHLARLFLPFHPPRRAWISQPEFDHYRRVITAHCQTLDRILAGLRQLAGAGTAVMLVSAHGTRQPDVPPAGFPQQDEEGWISPHGIVAAAGTGFARDSLMHGASVLDIAPTILAWFGLPIGDDMEGRVLLEGFVESTEVKRLPTWDPRPAAASVSTAQTTGAKTPAATKLQMESRWNLVRSCLEAGRLEGALPLLEELFRAFPENPDFCYTLFECQLNLKQVAEAEATLEALGESLAPGPALLLAQAELALAKRDWRQVRTLVEQVHKANPTHRALLRRLGMLLLRLRQWDALAELARAALAVEENDPLAWLALAEASLRRQKPKEAERAAQRAIQLKYFLPDAHFVLARALVALSRWNEAREAITALRKLQPQNKAAAGYERRISQPPLDATE
jgi:tetratricopeptide (TPR) repeat protein